MPLEGHWQRQHTPLRLTSARERRVLAAIAALLAAAIIAVVIHSVLSSSTSSSSAACVDVTAASTLGGARVHACGRAAERLCSSADVERSPLRNALRSECRRLRVPSPAP